MLIKYMEKLDWDLSWHNYLEDIKELKIFGQNYSLTREFSDDENILRTMVEGLIRDKKRQVMVSICFNKQGVFRVEVTANRADDNEEFNEYDLKYFYLNDIKGALFDIRDKKKAKYTLRIYRVIYNSTNFSSKCKVNGEYKFIFGPLEIETKSLKEDLSEQIVCFDIEVEASNFQVARSMAYNKVSDICAFLSVLYDVGFDQPRSVYRHFIEKDKTNNTIGTRRLRTGFMDKELNLLIKDNLNGLTTISDACCGRTSGYMNISNGIDFSNVITQKGLSEDTLEKTFEKHRLYKVQRKSGSTSETDLFTNTAGQEKLQITNKIGIFFKNIVLFEKSDKERYRYFRNSCRLYNLAVKMFMCSATAHIAILASAVESLAKSEGSAFSQFIKKYSDSFDKDFVDFIYGNVRSGFLHAGEFPFFEYNVEINNGANSEFFIRENDCLKAKELLRNVFIRWIQEKVIEFDESKDL